MRAFDDADVIHVEDRVDPVEDIEIITKELRLKARPAAASELAWGGTAVRGTRASCHAAELARRRARAARGRTSRCWRRRWRS